MSFQSFPPLVLNHFVLVFWSTRNWQHVVSCADTSTWRALAPATQQDRIMCAYLWKSSNYAFPTFMSFQPFPPFVLDSYGTILCFFFLRCLSCRYIYLACAPVTSSASNNVRILVKNLQNIESLRLCLSSLFPHLFWTHMERFCPPHTLTLSWLPCPLHSHGWTISCLFFDQHATDNTLSLVQTHLRGVRSLQPHSRIE